ncbi:hypothetical protein GGQ99_004756 [Aminobacter niigataensis]|uniref:Uncharacterized protein n=1 Tax=Aminobacter niigataensis TaxID=83265 RepID=A0ABR6L844_9HYPH|nr:hypothetical protein [Aminobacter niigataensis]MBB4652972.1 hypothetical protein [Aminobacter niigataensis]
MIEAEIVESSTKSLESLAKGRSPRRGGGIMSSVTAAFTAEKRSPRQIIQAVGDLLAPNVPAKSQFAPILRALIKFVPQEYHKRVTERRVRGIYNGDARRVEWYEVQALLDIEATEEARRAKLKLATTAHILAAHLAAEGAPLDGHQMRALGRLAGALDLSGTGGDAR